MSACSTITFQRPGGRRCSLGPAALGALICVGLALAARPAHAARFAVLLGNDVGQGWDARLHFAESDTVRMAGVLSRLGGFAPDDTVTLLGRPAEEVRAALTRLAERLRATPGEHLVVVYYSGHADAQALHLGESSLSLAELKDAVTALPAAARVLILDACRAGVLTRAKGGHPGPGFEVMRGVPEQPEGIAILASSTGSELAQESDQLAGSVFTHFLRVGLSGLADRNRDGEVSLVEAFDYVSERTLAATLGTTTGPQHPTFRLDMAGRQDLTLTRPGLRGAGYGHVRLDVPGWYFVHRSDGTIALETTSGGTESVALESGTYEITRREPRYLDIASVQVSDGASVSISGAPSRHVAFGRMVRKGGGREVAYAIAASTSTRTPIEALGWAFGANVAARADLPVVSAELRLGFARAHRQTASLISTTWDGSAALAALRFHDTVLGRERMVAWAYGIAGGVAHLAQLPNDGEGWRRSWVPFAGPAALVEVGLGKRLALRADVGVPFYALRVDDDAGAHTAIRPAVQVALGAGVQF